MMTTRRPLNLALAAGTILTASAPALAQFSSTAESPDYTASTTGVALSGTSTAPGGGGQDDWYIPVAGSFDEFVFRYAGNAPPWAPTNPIPVNPLGGAQFAAGFTVSAGLVNNTRAQHQVDFTAGGAWSAEFDQLVRYDGPTATVFNDNISSFSMQPAGCAQWQNLVVWTNTSSSAACNIRLGCSTPASPTALDTTLIPGAPFVGVPTNHWIRLKYWFNFTTRTMDGASIRDLSIAGSPAYTIDLSPNTWTLAGGVAGGFPLPTGARFFANGTEAAPAGHVIAWDNVTIHQETFVAPTGACCLPNETCSPAQTYNQCINASGVYKGDAVNCANVVCLLGACCFSDGSCQRVNTGQCAAQSGIYRGDGTNCNPNVCPQPGACCLADGVCGGMLATACAARTGVFRGEGILCGAVTCPQPFDYETGHGDAGDLRPTAPIATGTGPLPGIAGSLNSHLDVDMYDIFICNPSAFRASTVTWGNGMDTMLFLFKENGIGVVIDDDAPGIPNESTLSNINVTAPGRYYLAIGDFDNGPVGTPGDGTTRLWISQAAANSVPNGPGAAMPVAGWFDFGPSAQPLNFYRIALLGTCYVDHPCYANCDSSTIAPCLNVQDFGCFLNKFAGGDSYANCDNSTLAPILNVQDFGCFLNRFAAGCSNC